ncbi:MAG: hypothetical protein EBR33_00540 [Synechococcaceae bacterium WB4_1_0192]|nr:hypothetical protein [Synechococcaceae bacterium WB4_1_0192]
MLGIEDQAIEPLRRLHQQQQTRQQQGGSEQQKRPGQRMNARPLRLRLRRGRHWKITRAP